MTPRIKVIWTDELITMLRRLHSEGLSGSQIASMIPGATRNAIIGKIHRLGLTQSDVSGHRRKTSKSFRPPRPSGNRGGFGAFNIQKPLTSIPFVAPVINPLDPDKICHYDDLGPGRCNWPVDVEGRTNMYCGGDVDPDKFRAVYCKVHGFKATNRRNDPISKQIKPGNMTRGLGR